MDDRNASYVEAAYAERDAIVRSIERRFGPGAEDHVAEAYARCCAADLNDPSHAVKWVARAAAHLAIDANRSEAIARRNASRLVLLDGTESAESAALESELHERLASAVAALPDDQRQVIRAYAEGVPTREIANRVGRSVYAVKHVIARTLQQLREQLRDVELALVAFCARRRRRWTPTASVAASPLSMTAVLPAAVMAFSVTLPLAGQGVAFIMGRQRSAPGTVASSAAVVAWNLRDMGVESSLGQLHMAEAAPSRRASATRAARPVADHAARAVTSLPDHPDVEAAAPAGEPARVQPGDGAPSWVEYEPEPDDPVGDATHCLTHPVITPERIYCEQPR